MKKTLYNLVIIFSLSILFNACNSYKEALKTLPNELSLADECKNTNKTFERDCYDIIAYKNSFAQIRLGIQAQTNRNYNEAFQRYSLAKKRGNFYANALLADMYNKGLGVKKNRQQVIDLLEDTKDVDPISAYKLSFYYLQKKDYDEALKLLEFAANNNIKKAQYDLYKIYREGKITNINITKSKKWFEKYEDKSNRFINKIYGI